MDAFVSDIEELRRRAREHIEQGPITSAYGADRQRVIDVLNEALATELVCVLRYKRHYFTATGLDAGPVTAARHRGAGACRPDRRPDHPAPGVAELRP